MKQNINENLRISKPPTTIDEGEVSELAMQNADHLVQLFHEKNLRDDLIMGSYLMLDDKVQQAINDLIQEKKDKGMGEKEAYLLLNQMVEQSFNEQFPEEGKEKIN